MTLINKTGASDAEFRARIAPFEADANGCPDQPHHGVDCPGDACRYAAPAPLDKGTGMGEGVQ